jgi:type IV secretion system protein VirD4
MKFKTGNIVFVGVIVFLVEVLIFIGLAHIKSLEDLLTLDYGEVFFSFLQPIHLYQEVSQHEMFQALQAAVGILAIVLLYKMVLENRNKIKEAKNEVKIHGNARWAYPKEYMNGKTFYDKTKLYKKNLKQRLRFVRSHVEGAGTARTGERNIHKNPAGTMFGLVDHKPLILKEKQTFGKHVRIPNQHTVIVGDTGSNKTYAFLMPNLLREQERSIVVVDVKGNLYRRTAKIKQQQGYDVRLFNFIDLIHCDSYNPLDYIQNPDDTPKVANALVSYLRPPKGVGQTDFFLSSAEALLSSFMNYVKFTPSLFSKDMQTIGTILDIVTDTDGKPMEEHLMEMFESLEDGHPAKQSWRLFTSQLSSDKMMGSIYGTLNNQILSLWINQKLRTFTESNPWNLQDLAESSQKTVVYVVIPENDDTYKLLINAFFIQMFRLLSDVGRKNGIIPTRPIIMLDEFANLGKLPNYENTLTTIREYQVSIFTIIQSLTQLDHLYGKSLREVIIGNHATQFLIGANDETTTTFYSKKLGNQTMEGEQTSTTTNSKGVSKNQSTQYYRQSLMTPDEIERMDTNIGILFARGLRPIQVEKVNLFTFFEGVYDEDHALPTMDKESLRSDRI